MKIKPSLPIFILSPLAVSSEETVPAKLLDWLIAQPRWAAELTLADARLDPGPKSHKAAAKRKAFKFCGYL